MDTPAQPGKHFRLKDAVLVFAIIFLAAVLLYSLRSNLAIDREPSVRIVCAANLKGIGTGFYIYANENGGMWPVPPHAPASQPETGAVRYAPGMIGKNRMRETSPADREISTTRSLWMLIRIGVVTPKSFICPRSEDTSNQDDDPLVAWDFKSWDEVSYGVQVPFGIKGLASSKRQDRMPLAADKGPYSAALEKGKPNPGSPRADMNSRPEEWQPWNSPNHGSEGQYVLLPDGHADFLSMPLGPLPGPAAGDNIYTRWASAEAGKEENILQRAQGTPPTGIETPWSDTDTLIYP